MIICFQQSYRARYESEGCRGPIRGISENGFPTIRVCSTFNIFLVFINPVAFAAIRMEDSVIRSFFHKNQ